LKTSHKLLLLNCILLSLSATIIYDWRTQLVTALLLFLPFVDRYWYQPKAQPYRWRWPLNLLLVVTTALLLYFYPEQKNFLISTLVFTALPEEWFFRVYLMTRLKDFLREIAQYSNTTRTLLINLTARNATNIVASIFFTLLHIPTQGWAGLTVFFPSLLFGWLYQKTNDLALLVLIHSLSNLIFVIFIQKHWF
jgi:membrane protease YdiL (CAAX protease family)